MAGEVSWNNLPSVILNEIFSYLSHNDKVRASSTCSNWRLALSHPKCWRNVKFVVKPQDNFANSIARTRYLVEFAARKLHNAVITFDSMDPACVDEISNVIESLAENANLKSLFLNPSNCSLDCPSGQGDDWSKYIESKFATPLINAIRKSHQMEALSLGCLEELISSHAKNILELIVNKHANNIKVLGLATIKDYPDDYFITDLNIRLLKPLVNLQILSIDYCHVNDNLLHILGDTQLQRLVVHVHGIMDEHPGTTEGAWTYLTRKLPHCELRLTLIHSYDGVDVLHTKILRHAMPLTHLKVFFCEKLNIEAVHQLSLYSDTLRSIWWVDSMSNTGNHSLVESTLVNPFVMCCWRCHKLEELVFIGHKYLSLDVIAVIRLRGETLTHLCLAADDIAFQADPSVEPTLKELQQEISDHIGRPWTALVEPQLHPVIWNPTAGDSDEFVLPIVLKDIEP
ncbi:F-box only protein 33-like [Macrosteles quadrilineatus]|uniref:F-box only protein 33-like n=1 Tax=Macrosteles quadrilineatus TaxID=74068 RepID=UPI0023E21C99|nr:F-box only protein 33-like [Macrosteles quadrilineatus]